MSDARSDVRCFGRAVVQMRELRNMSREQLAKKSKIKLAVLTAIEEGNYQWRRLRPCGDRQIIRRDGNHAIPLDDGVRVEMQRGGRGVLRSSSAKTPQAMRKTMA